MKGRRQEKPSSSELARAVLAGPQPPGELLQVVHFGAATGRGDLSIVSAVLHLASANRLRSHLSAILARPYFVRSAGGSPVLPSPSPAVSYVRL